MGDMPVIFLKAVRKPARKSFALVNMMKEPSMLFTLPEAFPDITLKSSIGGLT